MLIPNANKHHMEHHMKTSERPYCYPDTEVLCKCVFSRHDVSYGYMSRLVI